MDEAGLLADLPVLLARDPFVVAVLRQRQGVELVRGPSHPCKRCNQGHRWHDSVVSVQLALVAHGAVVLIIRRSWVRAPPAPHTFTCGNLCGWPPKEGWRAARRPRATVSPMSVMPVPERPGALCRQHPDPGLWISDLRFEQEEARRVCRIRPELADCRAWTLAQPAFRMDAGLVAAMTPAERFVERRIRRQKPWLAKLEPVGPGPVARHPSLTRYPGPKPPPFARCGADGHGRRRVRGIPQPERLSTRHLRGWPHGRR